MVSYVINSGYHILNVWFGIEHFLGFVFFVVNMGFVIYLIEIYFKVFGITAFIYISYKFIGQVRFFVEIGFVPIFHLKKPFNHTGSPASTNNMVNLLAFYFVFVHG